MKLLDLTLSAAEEDLALDEALLLDAEAGGEPRVLRFWERPDYVVVLGSAGILADDVDDEACAADGVPVLRRSSGGGTVLLGPGCLCFSVVVPYADSPALETIQGAYTWVLGRVAQAVPGAEMAGICDLALEGRKLSGNAQQRKRSHLLHQGTLLYSFDFERVGRYLRQPPRQPEYREGRSHEQFLRNAPGPAARLRDAVASAFAAREALTAWPSEAAARLVKEKYGQRAWQRRR